MNTRNEAVSIRYRYSLDELKKMFNDIESKISEIEAYIKILENYYLESQKDRYRNLLDAITDQKTTTELWEEKQRNSQ